MQLGYLYVLKKQAQDVLEISQAWCCLNSEIAKQSQRPPEG